MVQCSFKEGLFYEIERVVVRLSGMLFRGDVVWEHGFDRDGLHEILEREAALNEEEVRQAFAAFGRAVEPLEKVLRSKRLYASGNGTANRTAYEAGRLLRWQYVFLYEYDYFENKLNMTGKAIKNEELYAMWEKERVVLSVAAIKENNKWNGFVERAWLFSDSKIPCVVERPSVETLENTVTEYYGGNTKSR
jgi:hypothetical protein